MKKIHFSYDLKAGSYESGIIAIMTQLCSDLKNGSFREAKYIEQLRDEWAKR
jgi:hypothetical protein